MKLTTRSSFPDALLDCPAQGLHEALGGPTLFDLRRPGSRPIFVSVLQHGNETSGWDGVRRWLRGSGGGTSLILYVGNTAAAQAGVRTLPGQQDFNRAWNGGAGDEARLAHDVAQFVARAAPLFALDVHNNTGENPAYSVLTRLTPQTLGAALAFSDIAMLAEHPDSVQTRRMLEYCPATTIEVGTVADPQSALRVEAYLDAVSTWREVPTADQAHLTVYRNHVRVTCATEDVGHAAGHELVLRPELESFNFEWLEAGNVFAEGRGLRATDVSGADVTDFFFGDHGGQIVLKQSVILSMYTRDLVAALHDCVCYFMEPVITNG